MACFLSLFCILPAMKCPNCGAQCPVRVAECANYGVIIANIKKKLEPLEPAAPPAVNPWIARSVAVVFLIAWMIVLSLYYRRAVAVMKVRNPGGPARSR